MKTLNRKQQVGAWAASLLSLALSLLSAYGQTNYSLSWFTVDAGGSASTGGVFSVSGTIGQPDAGTTLRGGNFTVNGGFWSVVALQTPDAPRLTVVASAATRSVTISWPAISGWNLQQSSSADAGNWADVPTSPADDGTNKSVTVSPPQGNLFFRLKKQ